MSDYKRYISYLYRYEEGINKDNVGFVKLEAKATELKLSINIKTHEINESEIVIGVLYNRDVLDASEDKSDINEDVGIIEVEKIKCNECSYATSYRTTVTNVFDSGVNVERLLGVIIQTSNSVKFISKWNDEDIKMEKLVDKPLSYEELNEPNNEDNMEINIINSDENIHNNDSDVILNLNNFNESKIIRNKDISNENEKSNTYDFKAESLAKKIFKHYPGMYPFEDDEILECVKLEPHDIGIFSMDKWPLANNSFLLHGYYTYRHLIFAKMGHNNKSKYVLGVPGIFRDRERFMANMFGFKGFKGVRNKPLSTGEFGYWYLEIKL